MIYPKPDRMLHSIFVKHGTTLADACRLVRCVTWHAPWEQPFRLSGFPWFDTDRCYRRLPLKPSDTLPASVNNLANNTAGGQVAFTTDSRVVWVRAWLESCSFSDHMAATGAGGFDLYIGPPGRQRFCGITRFDVHANAYEYPLYQSNQVRRRNFTLNFPLYRAVAQVVIGLERRARLFAPSSWSDRRPIVVYGTSITQGGCASRPGMAYTNILSRRLNREVINLGFSGSGRAEPEVARTIAKIGRAAMFVIDCETNCGLKVLQERLAEFIRMLRARHPLVPIMVVSRVRFARDAYQAASERNRLACARFQRQLVERGRAGGDRHLYFLDGATLLGTGFDECTVDGVHTTDLGFMRMADTLAPVIAKLLKA